MNMMTPKEVASRLVEAADVLHRLPSKGLFPAGHGTAWPDFIRDPGTDYPDRNARTRASYPTPDEITRMDEALLWLNLLDDPQGRRLVWSRARKVPWKELVAEHGKSRATLFKVWQMQIALITSTLKRGRPQPEQRHRQAPTIKRRITRRAGVGTFSRSGAGRV